MPNPTVITIGRGMGSGGSYIGQKVAKRLGYAYLDRQILQLAAEELGCEQQEIEDRMERLQSFWDKLIAAFAMGAPDGIYSPALRWISDEQLIATERRLILELAVKGPCVVMGHGAFHLLRGRAKLLNVFVHAPDSFRIRRIMKIFDVKTEQEAAEMMQRSDQERNQYIRYFTGLDRLDLHNYHLTIDMGVMSFAVAEQMIADLVAGLRDEGDWPWVEDRTR